MSTNIFNRDDGNKVLSYAQIDKDFDNYWLNEARNPVRNRIRIGRQYQASVPALLNPNELDKQYKFEQREQLQWTPKNELNEQQLQQYLQLAKALSMFSKVVTKNSTAVNNETGNNQEKIENETKKDEKQDKNELNNLDILNKFKLIFKSLSQFVNAHHPLQPNSNCKLLKKNNSNNDILSNKNWTEKECLQFASALQICFKNFPLIKKEFLPFKSTKNIIDYYNLCLNQEEQNDDKKNQIEDEIKKCNELRNKLDARSADGKDTNLEQCSAILNQFINELIKSDNEELKESNNKNQKNNQDDSDNDDSSLNSSNNNSTIPKTTRTNSSTKTNVKSTNNEIKETKEQNNEKRNSKNFKLNDIKRTSRIFNLNKNNQTDLKPIEENKEKLKDEYEFDDKLETDCNSLGSLKFYKDGQLVLKLDAKQPLLNNKVKWEESTDPEFIKLKKQSKKKKIELNKSKKPFELNNKSKILNEDQDDSSSFESDNDSRASSEFNIQKPLTMNNFNKKAKVKVENNYYLPNPKKEDNFELQDFINKSLNDETNLKRKLRSPKNLKKNKILKLNECTNQLNISPNLIQQQLNTLINSPTFDILSSMPDLRQKLLEQNLNDISNFQKNNLNLSNNFNNLNDQQSQNFNELLASFNSQLSNNQFESIDSIKMRIQIENLMSNLNSLIETEQLK